jgi:signal transduction histidine kinase
MTGYTDFDLVVDGLKQHAFDLLAKPIEFEHLNWAISRALAFVMTQRLEEQYRIRLEEQVAKQTKLLCNQLEDLQQAQRKETEVDSLKREFLSLINHEFRTPLNGIMGAIQLMESTDSESDTSPTAYLPILKKSADRMSDLINKLLTLAEARSLNSKLEDQTGTISSTIEILAERFRKKAENSGIHFKAYSDANSNQHLKGSWDAVQIIASCLLDNALKFTERGDTVTCSISFERDEQFTNTGNIILLIIDTGKGIPLEKQELIMQPFTQLEHFLTRSKEGAGIGLAIVRSICDKQGGNLMLESSPEIGSSFTCTLPFTIIET